MDPLTQALAFEPFFTTRDPATHHGLGLSFVFGTVRQSGGFVEVDSAPGQGTVFTLWLPEHSPVAGAETPPLPWLRDEDPSSDTVLLVEDETGVRMLASHVLAREGYRVIEAASAEEGLARFEESSAEICLLVSDVVLPGMTGPQLAERVLARRPELPVLFVSGYTGEMVLGPRDLGEGRAFLQKPFSVEALLLRVSELLRTRSA